MAHRESDWLIVLGGRESLSHGEAASSDGSDQGKHGSIQWEDSVPYSKRGQTSRGNRT